MLARKLSLLLAIGLILVVANAEGIVAFLQAHNVKSEELPELAKEMYEKAQGKNIYQAVVDYFEKKKWPITQEAPKDNR